MRNHTDHPERERTATATAPTIAPLSELDDFDVADGEPDIRGWDVKTSARNSVGKVKDLIVDLNAMKVRYLDVELDRKAVGMDDDRHVLVPIGTARLDDDGDDVIIRESVADLRMMPAYDRKTFTRDWEMGLHSWYDSQSGTAGKATHPSGRGDSDARFFDDKGFWGKRRPEAGKAYLTRSEEELAVGKRRVEAGSVDVRKHVETERVRRDVPVTREAVTVERRPIDAASASGASGRAEIRGDEVRVPVMGEEVVVDKRTVPKEEIVIRKHAVQDEKTVEADLRKERVEVDKQGAVERGQRR